MPRDSPCLGIKIPPKDVWNKHWGAGAFVLIYTDGATEPILGEYILKMEI